MKPQLYVFFPQSKSKWELNAGRNRGCEWGTEEMSDHILHRLCLRKQLSQSFCWFVIPSLKMAIKLRKSQYIFVLLLATITEIINEWSHFTSLAIMILATHRMSSHSLVCLLVRVAVGDLGLGFERVLGIEKRKCKFSDILTYPDFVFVFL